MCHDLAVQRGQLQILLLQNLNAHLLECLLSLRLIHAIVVALVAPLLFRQRIDKVIAHLLDLFAEKDLHCFILSELLRRLGLLE